MTMWGSTVLGTGNSDDSGSEADHTERDENHEESIQVPEIIQGDDLLDRMEKQTLSPKHTRGDGKSDRSVGSMGEDEDGTEGGNTEDGKNEEFSQADMSLVGSVPVGAPPATKDLIWISEDHCRVIMRMKHEGLGNIKVVCGKLVHNCGTVGHRSKQTQPQARGSPAYYLGVTSPKGRTINGHLEEGKAYTKAEYDELRKAEIAEMELAGQSFAETPISDTEDNDIAGGDGTEYEPEPALGQAEDDDSYESVADHGRAGPPTQPGVRFAADPIHTAPKQRNIMVTNWQ